MKTGRPLAKPFGRVLRRVMNGCNVTTLRELATYLGASEGNVRNWHKRDRVPSDWIVMAGQRSGADFSDLLSPISDQYHELELDENEAAAVAVDVHYASEPLSAWALANRQAVRPDSPRPRDGQRRIKSALLPGTEGNELKPLVLSVKVGSNGSQLDYEVIPKIMGYASAGAPTGADMQGEPLSLDKAGEWAMTYEWLGRNLHHTTGNLASIQVDGDSMSPTLLDGETIIIDRGIREVDVDGIYVITRRGKRLVKRLQDPLNDTLVIISDNPKYQSVTIPRGSVGEIEVLGRMVWPRVR